MGTLHVGRKQFSWLFDWYFFWLAGLYSFMIVDHREGQRQRQRDSDREASFFWRSCQVPLEVYRVCCTQIEKFIWTNSLNNDKWNDHQTNTPLLFECACLQTNRHYLYRHLGPSLQVSVNSIVFTILFKCFLVIIVKWLHKVNSWNWN